MKLIDAALALRAADPLTDEFKDAYREFCEAADRVQARRDRREEGNHE